MRVAINIHRFSPSKGGGEMHTFNFARQLVRDGHEVHIFASCRNDANQAESEGFIYHEVHTARLRSFRELSFALSSARALNKYSFDIIHGFGRTLVMDVSRLGGGVHIAWFWQDLNSIESSFIKLLKFITRAISLRHISILMLERIQYCREHLPRIIAPSKMVKNHLIKYYHVPEDQISVIYNGVDLERFHPRNKDSCRHAVRKELGITDEFMILFVANNFRLKGLRYLIKAIGQCRKCSEKEGIPPAKDVRNIKCVVVGRGHEGTYRRLAKKLGCGNNIIFVGETSEIERYYAAADLLAHPTFYDPCANVCLEALASGLPVITTTYNGIGEIITEGREGLLISDPKDSLDFASKIAYFFPDDVRAKASTAARELAEHHSLEKNYAQIFHVYEEVLAERASHTEA